MKTRTEAAEWSRRRFMERMAQGTLAAGAVALAGRPLAAAEKNPFAYDVSRFAKTDPALVGWVEMERRTCPGKSPRRLAFGPEDVLHVAADTQVLQVGRGGSVRTIELGARVTCLAVAGDGTVYAGLRDRIAVLDSAGVRRATWEPLEARAWLSGLAVSANGVFAADSGQRVIHSFDRAGQPLRRIGGKEPSRNVPGLVVPSPFLDVKLGADGLLRVNNPGRHRYEAYTQEGDLEATWGTPSAAISGFCGCCNPICLALLADGRVVTGEKGLTRVKVLRPDGTLESVVAGPESFPANVKAAYESPEGARSGLDVAVDASGRIHILDRVTAEIRVLQPKKGAA